MGWPDVSSSYGIYDLAGFAKDGVGYYKAWWKDGLCAANGGSISISPNEWTAPVPTNTPIDVVVHTCAASVQLFINGMPAVPGSQPQPVERFGCDTSALESLVLLLLLGFTRAAAAIVGKASQPS